MARRDDFDRDLEQNVKRVLGALSRGVADHLERTVERARDREEKTRSSREQRREEKRQRRLEERRQRRDARFAETSRLEGATWLVGALALILVALVVRPDLWWLVLPALLLGLRGARILAWHGAQAAPPPLPASGDDLRDARIESTCDRILAAVEQSPERVQAFLGTPKATVERLRTTARDLTKRERALRALVNPEEDGRLAAERDRLAARIAATTDAVARERFQSALDALDQQLAHRTDLARMADRLEAERTRLAYTLEGLHAQIVRLQSADAAAADAAGAGLRSSLSDLHQDVAALADALEDVNRLDAGEPVHTRSGRLRE